MISLDDEEKKKRYERAINLTRSITGDYSSDFNNIALNNIQGNTDEEKEYIKRFNRARELTNSINPRENVPAPSATPEEIASSREVANSLLEEMQRGRETNTQTEQGNIDLNNRDVVQNADGSISTVRSISFEEDGKEVLIPTVVNGKVVSDKEAIEHYHKTGEHLGKFNSVEEANAYAEQLHKQQENLYSNTNTSNNGMSEKDKKKIKSEIESKVNNSAKPLQTVTADGEALKKNQITSNNAMNQLQNTSIAPNNTPRYSTLQKAEESQKKWYQKFFKGSEAFNDGYQTGDITKTAVSSVADLALNFIKGVVTVGEGVGKFIAAGIAQGIEGTGNKEKADKIRKNIATGTPPMSSFIEKIQDKYIDKNSVFGGTTDSVGNSGGYTGGLLVATMYGGAAVGNTVIFGSAAGNTATEVYQKDNISNEQAWTKIIGGGAIETLTENLFGIFGKTGVDEAIANKVSKKLTSGMAKTLARYGISATGEATEEFISYALGQGLDGMIDGVNKMTGGKYDNFYENPNFEELGESMAVAWISTLFTNGGTTATQVSSIKSNSDVSTKEAINIIATQQDQQAEMERQFNELDKLNKKMQNETSEKKFERFQLQKEILEGALSIDYPYYVTKFNTDGEITSLASTYGIPIDNINTDLNIEPVVAKNGEYYNIIDANSGIELDTTPYSTIEEAEKEFNKTVKKLNDIQIDSINDKVEKANLAMYQKRDQLMEEYLNNKETDNTTIQNETQPDLQNDTIEQNNIPTQESNNQENEVAQNGFSEEINDNSIPTEKVQQEIQNNNIEQKSNSQVNKTIQTENKSFEDVAMEAMQSVSNDEVESPLQNRNIETIGKQKDVKAYQYDNPEVKPYFQEMAKMIGEDLSYISDSANRSTIKGGGTKLSTTTKAIDILHNEQGYSYNQIAQGIQNIIDDDGKENNAISKKLELIIDEQLRNGYTNALGKNIEANQGYINTIENKNISNQIDNTELYNKYKKVSKDFIDNMDNVLQNIIDRNRTISALDSTPKVFQNVGMNDLPVVMSQEHIRTTILTKEQAANMGYNTRRKNYHGLGKELLLNVINNIDNPISIYQWQKNDLNRYNENDFIVITELKNSQNERIIVPILANKKDNNFISVNSMKSSYRKRRIERIFKRTY